MIKLVQCVRKKPHLEPAEFRRHWREYGERIGEIAEELGAVRVVLDTTLAAEVNFKLIEGRDLLAPFDGIAQIWWARGAGLLESAETDLMRSRLARFREFQEAFVEIETSSFFFVGEETAYDLGG